MPKRLQAGNKKLHDFGATLTVLLALRRNRPGRM
jgi:hypothetical protein